MRLKVNINQFQQSLWILFESYLLILETSKPKHNDTSMDNTDEITEVPSACNQSTQTEDVLELTKDPSGEDIFEEHGTTKTESWLLIDMQSLITNQVSVTQYHFSLLHISSNVIMRWHAHVLYAYVLYWITLLYIDYTVYTLCIYMYTS